MVFSLKLVHVASLSTAFVISLGIFLIIPTFIRPANPADRRRIMLSFSIADSDNVAAWCANLSAILKTYNAKATVFFAGRTAEEHPESLLAFGDGVDVGSQTYSYVNLTSISDYTVQLEEVRRGKLAVDVAGNLSSKLFKAPYGSTDQNIYSLLSQSGIVADFSYERQYNVFYDGQFIKFDATSYDGSAHSAEYFLSLPKTAEPIILTFDNTVSTGSITELVSRLAAGNVQFVSASEITGMTLTERS